MKPNDRETDQRRKSPLPKIAVTLLLLLMAIAGARALLVSSNPVVLKKDQEMMFDDFGFSLVDERWVDKITLPDGTAVLPQGKFAVLTVRIANHAKRVDFKADPRRFILTDGRGDRITCSSDIPGNAETTQLTNGDSITREVVFDVPATATNLRLRVVFGGRVVELADWLLLGDRYFPVKAPSLPKE